MKRIVSLFLAIVLICLTFCLASCESTLGDRIIEFLGEKIKFEYKISLSFNDDFDRTIFENRLDFFGLTVKENKENNYILESSDLVDLNFFEILCSNHDIIIIDDKDNQVISQKEILTARWDLVSLECDVSANFKETFQNIILSKTIYLLDNSQKYELLCYVSDEDEGNYFNMLLESDNDAASLSDSEKALVKFATCCTKQTYKDNVIITEFSRIT